MNLLLIFFLCYVVIKPISTNHLDDVEKALFSLSVFVITGLLCSYLVKSNVWPLHLSLSIFSAGSSLPNITHALFTTKNVFLVIVVVRLSLAFVCCSAAWLWLRIPERPFRRQLVAFLCVCGRFFEQQCEKEAKRNSRSKVRRRRRLTRLENTVKSRFNESRFNEKSRFKERNLVTKMKILIKKSRFSIKSQFKEWKGTDGGHSLNRDFTVLSHTHSVNSRTQGRKRGVFLEHFRPRKMGGFYWNLLSVER